MNEGGWIKLHRQITEKGYYTDSAFIHLWVHLLIKANHKEKEFLFNGKLQICERGQLITGIHALARETGIHRSKVERILRVLESEKKIEKQANNKFSLITILNYENYQESEKQKEKPARNQREASEKPARTNKNEKNIKNEKKENAGTPAGARKRKKQKEKLEAPPEKYLELARKFYKKAGKRFTDLYPDAAEDLTQLGYEWGYIFEKLDRIDKCPPEKADRILDWLFSGEKNAVFWLKNTHSPAKLRKKNKDGAQYWRIFVDSEAYAQFEKATDHARKQTKDPEIKAKTASQIRNSFTQTP
jgi:predicted transcriptional regulator